MTNTTESTLPPSTEITESEVNPAYKDKALSIIKKLVSGNKFALEEVQLTSFDGKTLRFSAQNLLTLQTKHSKATQSGLYEDAIKVQNEESATNEMDRYYAAMGSDRGLEQEVHKLILSRTDKGFNNDTDNVSIALPKLTKKFVISEQCTACRGKSSTPCLPCNGSGKATCQRCKGTCRTPCTHCSGSRMVAIPGDASKKIACPVCRGQGYVGCISCNQTGHITCKSCNGHGSLPCMQCDGTGQISHIYTQEIQLQTRVLYPKDKLPDKVTAKLEEQGLDITQHADIHASNDRADIEKWTAAQENKPDSIYSEIKRKKQVCFPLLYTVTLPYGQIEYALNDKKYEAFIFGKASCLTYVSPFLDDLLREGIKALESAAQRNGNTHTNLMIAGEYRTLKEGIILTAMTSLNKAKNKLKAKTPYGLSDTAISSIISLSDQALKNITRKSRITSLIVAGLAYLVAFAGYFLTPLHQNIAANIPNTALQSIADMFVLCTIMYIGMMGIQAGAQSVLKKAINALHPNNQIKTAPPKLGGISYWNIALAGTIFLTIIEISRHITGIIPPAWYAALF